jgi:membrane-bound metal-dependent hydrolase YbcI (DUF457 family)
LKGIAHFAVGVAVATCFPEVVDTAASALALGPVLGGLAGLLPDTLDFKFLRYLHASDVEIDPAHFTTPTGSPDVQAIADRLASAAGRAHAEERPVRVRLHTLQLSAGLWRRWSVAFDTEGCRLTVRLGPVVTTGQIPVSERATATTTHACARPAVPVHNTYGSEIVVDIFSGPDLTFRPAGESVEVDFLPWHRAWTHSLAAALLVGALGSLIAPVYGAVMALALLAHAVVDQLGHMGSNLFFPLTRRRTPGLRLFHSTDALPNFVAVWLSVAVVLLNLDRFSGNPLLPVWPYLIAVVGAPCLMLLVWRAWVRRPASAGLTLLDEAGQVDI